MDFAKKWVILYAHNFAACYLKHYKSTDCIVPEKAV